MPDKLKQDVVVNLSLNMKALARIHYFCLRGIQGEIILTEQQANTHYKFLSEVENILLRSGYMTPAEIRALHTNMPEVVSHDNRRTPFKLDS